MHFVGRNRDDAFLVLGVGTTQVVTYFAWNPATPKPHDDWPIIAKYSISGFSSSHTHKAYPW